jgi:hypothetical protein
VVSSQDKNLKKVTFNSKTTIVTLDKKIYTTNNLNVWDPPYSLPLPSSVFDFWIDKMVIPTTGYKAWSAN